MQQDTAEILAFRALAWLSADDELLGVFLGSTGTSAQDIRDRATDPEFLGSVLDFLMLNDEWIVAFCDASGFEYDQPQTARQALPGGAQVNWT